MKGRCRISGDRAAKWLRQNMPTRVWIITARACCSDPLVLVGLGAKKQTASDCYTTYRARWPHEVLGRVVIQTSPVPSSSLGQPAKGDRHAVAVVDLAGKPRAALTSFRLWIENLSSPDFLVLQNYLLAERPIRPRLARVGFPVVQSPSARVAEE